MYISQKNSRITESFEKFVNELKSMSRRCEFEIIAVDEIIRDKIINGMRNDQLRRQLITKEKLTCDELIKICRINHFDELPKCEIVMLKPEWGSYIRFQIDNGTSVNKIPLSIYHKASKDYQNKYIKTSQTKSIAAF